MKEISVRIERTTQEPSYYEVRVPPAATVLDVLEEIYRHHDPAIAYRYSCRTGLCTTCMMTINGKPGLSCQKPANPGRDGVLTLAPLPKGKTIQDLVKEAKV